MSTPEHNGCRSCGGSALEPILALGRTPLANALLDTGSLEDPEPSFPLDLAFCPACTLVQITETVPAELLFTDYCYFSSYSDTMLTHARTLVERVIAERDLTDESQVIEVASNDGYLLQYYRRQGIPVLGIEPAETVARVAIQEREVPTVCEYFGGDLADLLVGQGTTADVIHAHNVLAHVAGLNDFVAALGRLLKPDGLLVVECPYVVDLVEQLEFDTIYHEHLCYFSLTALDHLFERQGLTLVDVERVAIHGGSLRLFARRSDDPTATRGESVVGLLAEEAREGVDRFDFYASFARRVTALQQELQAVLERLRSDGGRIAAYGASAKGCTLLTCCGIDRETIEYVVDRSPAKQGRFTPGTHLPIMPPETLVNDRPDFVLLLAWNFREEILEQQAEYRGGGGRFIIPCPRVTIV